MKRSVPGPLQVGVRVSKFLGSSGTFTIMNEIRNALDTSLGAWALTEGQNRAVSPVSPSPGSPHVIYMMPVCTAFSAGDSRVPSWTRKGIHKGTSILQRKLVDVSEPPARGCSYVEHPVLKQ